MVVGRDEGIIALLREDGRLSARDIAKALDPSSSTVRKRIRGMEQAGIMRVVAVTDFAAAGFDLLLAIGIEVENRNAEAVGREKPEVRLPLGPHHRS